MSENLADDMMSGATEIAEFIGEDERRTYYMLEKGMLPAFKFGKGKKSVWRMRKSTFRQHIERLEQRSSVPAE
jgi:hypothetical protein